MILEGLNLAIRAIGHEVGIDFFNLLGDQPQLDRFRSIFRGLLVAIGHRPQVEEAKAVARQCP